MTSHCIEPASLRSDGFWDFYAARAEALLDRIEAATGKTVAHERELFGPEMVPESYDEGYEEWEAEESLEESVS